jgi:Uma2 family endonuclease
MAESNLHVSIIIQVREVLRQWLRAAKNASVYANMLLYFREGNPKVRVSPDVFVVLGVPFDVMQRSYKIWEEQQAPQIVFEITSRKTQATDLGKKRFVYARLGVSEYYLFDPFREYLDPPLRGYQLVGEEYVPAPLDAIPPPALNGHDAANDFSQSWRLSSEKLKLEIWAFAPVHPQQPCVLRFYDPEAGEWLTDPEQAMSEHGVFKRHAKAAETRAANEARARKAAEERALAEAHARKAAEERLAQLEAEFKK